MGGGLEIELKLRAEGSAPLATLLRSRRLGPARLGSAASFDEVDRYVDTVDRRLAAAGWACRLRSRGDVTLISLKGAPQHTIGASLHRRPEVEGAAGAGLDPAAWRASPARSLLVRLAGGAPLEERLVLEQRRTERGVELDDARVGTLSLDVVRVLHRGRHLGTLHIVELELLGAVDESRVEELADALAAVPGLSPDPLTKLEHALALAGIGA